MVNLKAFQAAGLAMTVAATPAGAESAHVHLPNHEDVGCGVVESIGNYFVSQGLRGVSTAGFTGVEEASAYLHEIAKARISDFMQHPDYIDGYQEIRKNTEGEMFMAIHGFVGLDPSTGAHPNAGCIFKIPDP